MKFNRSLGIASLGALILALSGTSLAQAQTNQATSADRSFVKAAIEGGNAEIELGQLAMERGNSNDVKQFGKRMMDDHNSLGEQMKAAAGQIGVTPPTVLSAGDKALEIKLKMLSDDDFDKAYIKAMVKDHQQDLTDFRKEAANGTSQAVKDAASQGVQVISTHLQMIQQIAQAHSVAVAKNSGAGGQ